MVRGCFHTIGDYGDKFYIILEGTVSIHVPKRKTKQEDENFLKKDDNDSYVKKLS